MAGDLAPCLRAPRARGDSSWPRAPRRGAPHLHGPDRTAATSCDPLLGAATCRLSLVRPIYSRGRPMTADHEQIRQKWLRDFKDLETFGPPHKFSAWKLSGLYAVASICYHGNEFSPVLDATFDSLCRWLLQNFEQCVAAGADKLERELLVACSGYAVHTFVKPYHDVAAWLVGHACRCASCNPPADRAAASRARVGAKGLAEASER